MFNFFKKRAAGILLIILLMLTCTVPALAEENLLVNGDFSQSEDGMPVGWEQEAWYTDSGVSVLSLSSDGYDGTCIMVKNNTQNDARFAQTVEVEPNTIYHITVMCKAEGVGEDGIGANISIKNTFVYSETLTDTDGEWVQLELYGKTGSDQTEVTVYARLGGYSNENVGCAWFDNFEMAAVDEAPAGAEVRDISPIRSSSSSASTTDEAEEPERYTQAFVLLTCVYVLAVVAVARKHRRTREIEPAYYGKLMILITIGAFILRLVIAARVPGYYFDINCFSAWSTTMSEVGPAKFYNSGIWCDYPPLYMWMLLPVGLIQKALGLATRSAGHLIVLKMWPILFDLASAWLIWKCGKKKLGARAAFLLAAFFAFNPAVFVDSAAWGQVDSVLTLLVVLCALWATEEKYVASLVSFALAMLVKPQALLFAPLGLFAIAVQCIRGEEKPVRAILWTLVTAVCAGLTLICIKLGASLMITGIFAALAAVCILIFVVYAFCQKENGKLLRKVIWGILAALGIIYLAGLISTLGTVEGLWNSLIEPVRWIVDRYTTSLSGYRKVTLNTLNIYYLRGLNWANLDAHKLVSLFAWACFAGSYVYCGVLCALSKEKKHLLLIGGLLIILICNFAPMIHERYIFPAVLLLILGYVYTRDKRVLIGAVTVSACLFLNEVLVLQGGMTSYNSGHLQADENWINYIVCFINIANALFMAWTALDICVLGHIYPMTGCKEETSVPGEHDLFKGRDHKLHLGRIDAILMTVVTLVYAVAAFTNLGSMSAPQTTWTSGSAGESVTFDLGETQRFRLTYYGNICNTNFTVELSEDGETWSTPYYAAYDQGEIFRWLWYVPQTADGTQASALDGDVSEVSTAFAGDDGESYPFQTARYVRITAVASGLKLSEIGFLNEDGEALPIVNVEQTGDNIISDANLLADEQDTIPDHPSYYNSTYFDEIYHARTAYEHLHGLSTYEWTHPPLGKVLMMVGIQIFGMTPFGWRFMGALVGVLMVPLMYLLVKQLTKSTKLSFIAMFLLSVDSMHFTQTRLATIDSYAVFWIMLMYFFMFRYCQMQWHSVKDFKRSLVTLGLCGVTMGIAWATKWIGLYASAGLAILFFWSLWQRWKEYQAAQSYDGKEYAALCDETVNLFWTAAVVTIAFCLVFFILIPSLIYYFSYYWYLRGKGITSFAQMFSFEQVRTVIDLQKTMYNYHAGLGGDTHYFRSPWYEWPVIWWPMWYYSGTSYMPDGVISSISCMGNPAVWWFGLIALIFIVVRLCWVRRASRTSTMVTIGFASQFLPWVLVPRSTFIYHYFASVPFIIIASVLMLKWIRGRSDKAFKIISATLMVLALILFIAFYPLESGMPVARSYAQYLRWFKWYNF